MAERIHIGGAKAGDHIDAYMVYKKYDLSF